MSFEQLKELLARDTNPRKPKKIKGYDGKFTKTFLKWNREVINKGLISFYADEDYFYNMETGRPIKKRYDTRFKTPKLINKFSNIQNNIINVPEPAITSNRQNNKIRDRFIKLNSGEITQTKFNLSKNNLKDILEGFRENTINLKVFYSFDGIRFYTLNQGNIDQLINNFNNENYYSENGSDAEIFRKSRISKFIYIKTVPNKQGLEGAFFKYYHNLEIDLCKYGIYKNDADLIKFKNNNCLYYALEHGGLNKELLTHLKTILKNRNIPLTALPELCKDLNICIELSRPRTDNKKTRKELYGNPNNQKFKIGLIDNHYFIIDEVKISKFSLENYDEIKNLENPFNICKKTKEGKFKRENGRFIDSFDLFIILLENKEKLLNTIKFNKALLSTQYYNEINNNELILNSDENDENYDNKEYYEKRKIKTDEEIKKFSENKEHYKEQLKKIHERTDERKAIKKELNDNKDYIELKKQLKEISNKITKNNKLLKVGSTDDKNENKELKLKFNKIKKEIAKMTEDYFKTYYKNSTEKNKELHKKFQEGEEREIIEEREKRLDKLRIINGVNYKYVLSDIEIAELKNNFEIIELSINEPFKDELYKIIIFDFETFINKELEEETEKEYDEDLNEELDDDKAKEIFKNIHCNIHIPYLVCFLVYEEVDEKIDEIKDKELYDKTEDLIDNKNLRLFQGEECGFYMLENLPDEKNLLLYAHNLKYDFRFLFKYLSKITNIIINGSKIMSCSATYTRKNNKFKNKNINIVFRDTLQMINKPLGNFGECFKMFQEKEIMPYSIYNKETVNKKWVSFDIIKNAVELQNKSKLKKFIENCNKWGCVDRNKNINIIKYSSIYCGIDCKILKRGWRIFRKNTLIISGLDIVNYLTIASLAENTFILKGAYLGCYKISGVPREFIQRCVVGGRCMTRENKMYKILIKLYDFDACSLYPSSMYFLALIEGGFLKGIPKIIKNENLKYDYLIENTDGFFIEIKINNIPLKRGFPLLSKITKEGVREFTNDMIGEIIYIDKFGLKDLIEFHKLKPDTDFTIIKGYYFDEGRNPLIGDIIKEFYDERVKFKKEKNPIEVVYKELMNSGYGKTLLKPIETETIILNKKEFENYKIKNYNHIQEYHELDYKIIVKKIKPINNHFNMVHIGTEILSFSKHIMNRVITTAEDNNLNMYYQDTDSIHIETNDLNKLVEIYNKKYNPETDIINKNGLIGEYMGQFHTDFKIEKYNENDEKIKYKFKEIYSNSSYFLGKKCYIDELNGVLENGDIITDYHIRMKGMSNDTLKATAEEGFYYYYNKPLIIAVNQLNKVLDKDLNFITKNTDENKGVIKNTLENLKSEKENDEWEINNNNTSLKLKKSFSGGILSIFDGLFNGDFIDFDLCKVKPTFDFKRNFTVESKTEFIRNIGFNNPNKEIIN
jgi:hypothetical protein